MKKMIHSAVGKKPLAVLARLHAHGHAAVVAGGAVRDHLLGRSVNDVDIATSASLDEIVSLFTGARTGQVGSQFPIVLVGHVEVAPFRGGTLEEDLSARDLTINAMAWDPETDRVVDPWGGRTDMDNQVLRFTCNAQARIAEDPLRMLRMARFAADLNWEVDEASLAAMADAAPLINGVAKERMHHEVLKAMAGTRASTFFEVLRGGEILERVFPGMAGSIDHDGGRHHDETVWEHMMMAADAISPRFPLLRLAMALHDIAKPECAEVSEKGLRFIGHEKAGEPMVEEIMENLGFSNRQRAFVSKIVRHHMRRIDSETSVKAVRRILRDLDRSDLHWRDWMRGVLADGKANRKKMGGYSFSETRLMVEAVYTEIRPESGGAFSLSQLAVKGGDLISHLKLPPGPEVGRTLNALLERVIDDPELNVKEQLLVEAETLVRR